MVDWWTEVGLATSSFLDRHGLLAAFVFLLIEEAGVPVPVPGDVLMLVLGVHAREGGVELWQAIAATWGGTILGSTFLYLASRMAGRSLVYRYGRFIRLTPERLHIPFGLLGSLVPLTLILWWTWRARQTLAHRETGATHPMERDREVRAGALAGILATVTSTLLLNVLINLAGGIAFNFSGPG